jgi:hypothetical protein
MLAQDDGAGKKGKCPKCGHEVYVPCPPKKRAPLTMDEREKKAKAELALMNVAMEPSEDAAELIKEKAGWLIPVYDELSLFLMAATFILLSATNATMQEQLYKRITAINDLRVYLLSVIFLGGVVLSLYHVFTTREKTNYEKVVMLFFAVAANASTGIISGWYVLKNSDVNDWQLVFPVWNIINGVILLLMLRLKIIDEECISDRDANATEVVISMVAVLIIFAICNYVFKLYWAITFSICIIYTTSFDRALQSVFPGLSSQSSEPTS